MSSVSDATQRSIPSPSSVSSAKPPWAIVDALSIVCSICQTPVGYKGGTPIPKSNRNTLRREELPSRNSSATDDVQISDIALELDDSRIRVMLATVVTPIFILATLIVNIGYNTASEKVAWPITSAAEQEVRVKKYCHGREDCDAKYHVEVNYKYDLEDRTYDTDWLPNNHSFGTHNGGDLSVRGAGNRN